MRGRTAVIEVMATVRITEAELARDLHSVLAKVQEGVEVIVEQDHRPVAVIKTPQRLGRKISECIALAKRMNRSSATRRFPILTLLKTCKQPSTLTASLLTRPHGISAGLRRSDCR